MKALVPNGLRQMLKGALFSVLITLLALLPPLLHFITGPLGPLIGGFVGGHRVRAGAAHAVGIGGLVAAIIAIPALGVVRVFDGLAGQSGGATPIVLAIAAYCGVFSALGALAGGAVARRSTVQDAGQRPQS